MPISQSPSSPPARGAARAAILDAALALVRKQGWSATTVDQLCAAALVTKGAFFHHFASKEALGIAAAKHWSDVTSPLFTAAGYHDRADPLDRIIGYLDFRAALAEGPLEAFTCFAGTTLQEAFATSEPIRAACGATIYDHADTLVADLRAAIKQCPPRRPVTAKGLAIYTQTVLQGGFILSKAKGDRAPFLEAISHVKNYLSMLFNREQKL
jgi:TetR/AcrR family transcriptional regulator, transcriptional repressor for nem operon